MPKPKKINICGVLLSEVENDPFYACVEIKQNHDIADRAIVTISADRCVKGKIHEYVWKSSPIILADDIKDGPKSSRLFLKLRLTLSIKSTNRPCPTLLSPEVIVVTITNDPSGTPQTSDPEDADPIFFP